MHPIAQHLPVGPLITPFTIIIASITRPDTGKKTVGEQEENISNSVRWVNQGREGGKLRIKRTKHGGERQRDGAKGYEEIKQ